MRLKSMLVSAMLILSGCGDTVVVTPKEKIKEEKVETKEKVIHDNPGGSTTIEKKTETK